VLIGFAAGEGLAGIDVGDRGATDSAAFCQVLQQLPAWLHVLPDAGAEDGLRWRQQCKRRAARPPEDAVGRVVIGIGGKLGDADALMPSALWSVIDLRQSGRDRFARQRAAIGAPAHADGAGQALDFVDVEMPWILTPPCTTG
jgi:hypothetical protein